MERKRGKVILLCIYSYYKKKFLTRDALTSKDQEYSGLLSLNYLYYFLWSYRKFLISILPPTNYHVLQIYYKALQVSHPFPSLLQWMLCCLRAGFCSLWFTIEHSWHKVECTVSWVSELGITGAFLKQSCRTQFAVSMGSNLRGKRAEMEA